MVNLTQKILENNQKVLEYDYELSRTRRKNKLLGVLDKVLIGVAIISGFSILVISPIATIPCVLALGSSYLVHKKQNQYEMDYNRLTVGRGILLTENDKMKWEIEQNKKEVLTKEKNNDKMTVGIGNKTLVKTKSL